MSDNFRSGEIIRLSWAKVVPKNELSGSKNHLEKLQFAKKFSPGHKRIAVHRNSPQKGTQPIRLTPR